MLKIFFIIICWHISTDKKTIHILDMMIKTTLPSVSLQESIIFISSECHITIETPLVLSSVEEKDTTILIHNH